MVDTIVASVDMLQALVVAPLTLMRRSPGSGVKRLKEHIPGRGPGPSESVHRPGNTPDGFSKSSSPMKACSNPSVGFKS